MMDVGKNAKPARAQTTEWHGVFPAVKWLHLQLYRNVRPFLQVWKARRIAANLLFAWQPFFSRRPGHFLRHRLGPFLRCRLRLFLRYLFRAHWKLSSVRRNA